LKGTITIPASLHLHKNPAKIAAAIAAIPPATESEPLAVAAFVTGSRLPVGLGTGLTVVPMLPVGFATPEAGAVVVNGVVVAGATDGDEVLIVRGVTGGREVLKLAGTVTVVFGEPAPRKPGYSRPAFAQAASPAVTDD